MTKKITDGGLESFFVGKQVSGIISERDYVCKVALLGKASKDTTVRLFSPLKYCKYYSSWTDRDST